MMPSGQELLIILLIVVILFGGSKIPEMMKGLGKGIREFKKAKDDLSDNAEGPKSDSKPNAGDKA